MILIFLLLPFLLSFKLIDVPFVQQRDHFCGPASLSSLLKYYGLDVSQEEIAKSVYDPKLKGALITDLENYARKKGFKTELKQGSLEEVKVLIDRGIPPILLIDMGKLWVSVPHYIVIVGYEGRVFYAHTGYEAKKAFEEGKLEGMWSKMGKVMLIVYPP